MLCNKVTETSTPSISLEKLPESGGRNQTRVFTAQPHLENDTIVTYGENALKSINSFNYNETDGFEFSFPHWQPNHPYQLRIQIDVLQEKLSKPSKSGKEIRKYDLFSVLKKKSYFDFHTVNSINIPEFVDFFTNFLFCGEMKTIQMNKFGSMESLPLDPHNKHTEGTEGTVMNNQ